MVQRAGHDYERCAHATWRMSAAGVGEKDTGQNDAPEAKYDDTFV